eukprot:scaffold12042_cov61-Phaeocystis_antarctica.AAC.1
MRAAVGRGDKGVEGRDRRGGGAAGCRTSMSLSAALAQTMMVRIGASVGTPLVLLTMGMHWRAVIDLGREVPPGVEVRRDLVRAELVLSHTRAVEVHDAVLVELRVRRPTRARQAGLCFAAGHAAGRALLEQRLRGGLSQRAAIFCRVGQQLAAGTPLKNSRPIV